MLRNLIAGLLIVLTVLPFTAPFATVDVPTLLGNGPSTTTQQTTVAASIDDNAHAIVASSVRTRTRFRAVLELEANAASERNLLVTPGGVTVSSQASAHLFAGPSQVPLRI